jgi:hypothetical protein
MPEAEPELIELEPVRPTRKLGDIITLKGFAEGWDVILGTSESALMRAYQLTLAEDGIGLRDLESAGLMFYVPEGTQARVIGVGEDIVEVRIVGETRARHGGRSGFVPHESIK